MTSRSQALASHWVLGPARHLYSTRRIAPLLSAVTPLARQGWKAAIEVLAGHEFTLAEFVPRQVAMPMYADDVLVSEGDGTACLGDPLNALAWLARTAKEYGNPLCAGQIVLSGALGPMVPVMPGTRVHTEIGPLGSVSATFARKEGQ
ncbi:fumarylacetoacetate hydrolase family protein [Nocardia sp. CA-151230]|uniref:fumarylacetoacetate hydrolase family protein n=1 Tax=Nocardia sp. CA-151230 TaxID=3239982 RepID=UPI003D9101B1